MRKIEQQMIAAIQAGQDWKSGNTSVTHDPVVGGSEAEIRLHGNLIAKRFIGGDWSVSLCGWDTRTTRSRLAAILRTFARNGGKGLGVSSRKTRNGQRIMLHDARGMTEITIDGWHSVRL